MKYIKFVMSSGPPFTFPMEKAEKVIDSQSQLVKLTDTEGKWTGEVINKAHIVSTQRDRGEEEVDALLDNKTYLPKPDRPPVDIEKFKPEFLKKKDG